MSDTQQPAAGTDDELTRLGQAVQRLSDFTRASGDWLWESDAALKLTWLSDSFSTATGDPVASHLGRSLTDARLVDGIGPSNTLAAVGALVQQRLPFARVVTFLHTAQGTLKVSHSAVPFLDAAGAFAGYRGTARDVTLQIDTETRARAQAELLRHSEERWEMAAHATGIGIAELDVATGAMTFDDRACANHGLVPPARGFTGADWLASIHADDRPAAQRALHDAIAQCGRLETRVRVRFPDGSTHWLEVIAHSVRGADGRAARLIGTCRNVTQQVAHEQLLRDKEGAERANRAKSQFLSRMSHELRTPLNSILGFAQLMGLDRLHPLAAEQQQRLDSVHRAGRHLLGLINDVLELSRIEQEDFSLQLQPVDLADALNDCLSMISPLARKSGIDLPLLPATPCWVLADRRALEQIVMNLLSNAIKYNRSGGRVHVALRNDDGAVHLAVTDEGAGLSPAQQQRLFQHFERLGAETGRIEGTGLGLVISRELALALGAELRVHSAPGSGSTFTLVLPAADAAPAVRPPTAPAEAMSVAAPGPQRTVLYIEDERLNVVLMEEMFRTRPHWRLVVAEDGAEGMALARQERPDLLLIDMHLPDTTGLALVKALRADAALRGSRCIALSADAMSEQVETALAAGFDAYWTKPIDVGRVLADLGRLLD
jgi:PAS domain S-box-containing protein